MITFLTKENITPQIEQDAHNLFAQLSRRYQRSLSELFEDDYPCSETIEQAYAADYTASKTPGQDFFANRNVAFFYSWGGFYTSMRCFGGVDS